jgi:hypothetical protein
MSTQERLDKLENLIVSTASTIKVFNIMKCGGGSNELAQVDTLLGDMLEQVLALKEELGQPGGSERPINAARQPVEPIQHADQPDRDKELLLSTVNGLTPVEQVTLWRALGEELLKVGNSFQVMIGGMPHLEQAVYRARIELLKEGTSHE